jgi:hypothetical protein
MTVTVRGVSVPDSKLAREMAELVRDTESPLLFHHSSRVYYFGALAGKHRDLTFDPKLLSGRRSRCTRRRIFRPSCIRSSRWSAAGHLADREARTL